MENDTLNKIDEIIKRTNTDYGTAKEALEAANGDVLEAIILIENQQKGSTGSFRGEQIMAQLKDILAKGNATKLTIKKDNEVIVNIPITAGLVSAFIAPFLSAAGITVALLAKCSVEITQTDGKIIDLGQKVDEGIDAVKDAMQDIKKGAQNLKDDLRTGSKNIKDDIKTGAENVKDNIKAEAENMKDDLKNSFDRNNVHF
jgi:gas vesicle protein